MKRLIKRKDKPQFLPHLKEGVSLRKMMKIKSEHVVYMKNAIDKYIEANGGIKVFIEKYETGDFPNSDVAKNLNTRFCFDMLYRSDLLSWVCESIYPYADDNHILTALKSILPKLTRRY